jgi:DNA uptake protein ComE-like DNA-binding protein
MSKPIDINKATLEELTSITGIGEKRAQKIFYFSSLF